MLDLAATDRETFLRTIALDNRAPQRPTPAASRCRRPKPAAIRARSSCSIPATAASTTAPRPASGEKEKDDRPRFRPAAARADREERQIPRGDDPHRRHLRAARRARAHGARRQAALFVSIHADALPRAEGDAQGASVYTLSETASDAEAARLAEEENRADVIAGVDLTAEPDDVADILIDLAQRETKTFSMQFAQDLVGEHEDGHAPAQEAAEVGGFRVLRAPDVPSVLVELGYVSNREDLHSLLSGNWRNRTADSVAQAIDGYFATRMAGARAAGTK